MSRRVWRALGWMFFATAAMAGIDEAAAPPLEAWLRWKGKDLFLRRGDTFPVGRPLFKLESLDTGKGTARVTRLDSVETEHLLRLPSLQLDLKEEALGGWPDTCVTDFRVEAIAGEPPDFVAVITYRRETYIVQPGAKVPDEEAASFDVITVTADRVEVRSRCDSSVMSVPLNGTTTDPGPLPRLLGLRDDTTLPYQVLGIRELPGGRVVDLRMGGKTRPVAPGDFYPVGDDPRVHVRSVTSQAVDLVDRVRWKRLLAWIPATEGAPGSGWKSGVWIMSSGVGPRDGDASARVPLDPRDLVMRGVIAGTPGPLAIVEHKGATRMLRVGDGFGAGTRPTHQVARIEGNKLEVVEIRGARATTFLLEPALDLEQLEKDSGAVAGWPAAHWAQLVERNPGVPGVPWADLLRTEAHATLLLEALIRAMSDPGHVAPAVERMVEIPAGVLAASQGLLPELHRVLMAEGTRVSFKDVKQVFQKIGGPAIPFLREKLRSAPPEGRWKLLVVVRALGPAGSELLPDVMEVTSRGPGPLKSEDLLSIAGPESDGPELRKALGELATRKDFRVRLAALLVLASLTGDPGPARDAVSLELADPRVEHRALVIELLGRLRGRAASVMDVVTAAGSPVSIENPAVRSFLWHASEKASPPSAWLDRAVQHPAPEIRSWGAHLQGKVLARDPSSPVAGEIVKQMVVLCGDPDPDVSREAHSALAGGDVIVPAVLDAMVKDRKHPSIEDLESFGAGAAPWIVTYLTHPEDRYCSQALRSLRALPEPTTATVQAVIEKLSDPEVSVTREAVEALAAFGPAAHPLLLERRATLPPGPRVRADLVLCRDDTIARAELAKVTLEILESSSLPDDEGTRARLLDTLLALGESAVPVLRDVLARSGELGRDLLWDLLEHYWQDSGPLAPLLAERIWSGDHPGSSSGSSLTRMSPATAQAHLPSWICLATGRGHSYDWLPPMGIRGTAALIELLRTDDAHAREGVQDSLWDLPGTLGPADRDLVPRLRPCLASEDAVTFSIAMRSLLAIDASLAPELVARIETFVTQAREPEYSYHLPYLKMVEVLASHGRLEPVLAAFRSPGMSGTVQSTFIEDVAWDFARGGFHEDGVKFLQSMIPMLSEREQQSMGDELAELEDMLRSKQGPIAGLLEDLASTPHLDRGLAELSRRRPLPAYLRRKLIDMVEKEGLVEQKILDALLAGGARDFTAAELERFARHADAGVRLAAAKCLESRGGEAAAGKIARDASTRCKLLMDWQDQGAPHDLSHTAAVDVSHRPALESMLASEDGLRRMSAAILCAASGWHSREVSRILMATLIDDAWRTEASGCEEASLRGFVVQYLLEKCPAEQL